MLDYSSLERSLTDTLQLTRRPVGIAFRNEPPDGVERLPGSQPSGCSFWSLASEGRRFYTVPSDHYNCPIGSYTHNIPLPPEREHELPDTLKLMGELGYIRMEEVPDVPRLPETPLVAVYAPLAAMPVPPDVVVITGAPGGLMLLHEAALRIGRSSLPMLGRPTCMAIPAALGHGVASSLGCIGNRVYTNLAESDLYVMVRGSDLEQLMREMNTITAANVALAEYHRERRRTLVTAT
jgi:uncharacterized protein (DUF169 family)